MANVARYKAARFLREWGGVTWREIGEVLGGVSPKRASAMVAIAIAQGWDWRPGDCLVFKWNDSTNQVDFYET